jgi:branched-chain amino acid transport system ATP-binding protein
MKNEVLLQATNITKRYGGLLANQNVNITLERGKLHALLGPNGAGKSTCINMLSGDAQPSSGKIEFQNKDITNLTSWQRSQVGIGRSYQRTNIFPQFTVLENVRLAAQSRKQDALKIFSKAEKMQWAIDKAINSIEEAGLSERTHSIAGLMSHGEQRQLEIAMVLATDAQVLLLDEPLAGMGSEESEKMVGVLKKLRATKAILLVEHDMDAVFAVADTITVMVNGQVLESGSPSQIKNSIAVQEAYLGQEDSFHV